MIIDGATNWGPNGPKPNSADFDHEARAKAVYEWVRQVRGGVLAGVFTVESHLNASILYFVLGKRVGKTNVAEIFETQLMSGFKFDQRIRIVKKIAPLFLNSDAAATFLSDLTMIQKVRNAMAHHPFWFEPQLNANGKVCELVPVIKIGTETQHLTSLYIEELNAKISSSIDLSVMLAVKVKEHEGLDID